MSETKTYNPGVTERGNRGMKILTTYIDPELFRQLKVQAALDGKSMTEIVQELLKDFLKKKAKQG